jgi:hypothetical protein
MRINSKAGTQYASFDGAGAGEGLAIFFSQNGNASARYRVLVQAMIGEGVYDVGEFYISPPIITTAIPGRLSRMVASACCPGATSWTVEVSAVPAPDTIPAETADIILASSRCYAPFGVYRVGERYDYNSGSGNANFVSLPGRRVTGIAGYGLGGGGSIQIPGRPLITVPAGISVALAPEASLLPNATVVLTNLDWVVEYLESA